MNFDPEAIEYRAELLLCHTYPHYPWYVEVNRHTGQMEILNCAISMEKGMSINMHVNRTASEFEKIIKHFGGELLERANLPRRWTEESLAMFLANAERQAGPALTLYKLDES